MPAFSTRPTTDLASADTASAPRRSIDDLDAEIRALARHMNAETYRLLVLVREFDDRLGWAKWGLRNCAEWLAWRCGLSLSAAREKVRTAHALRGLPSISAAFADGRLSYSKVRALTRVAQMHDEDALLDYALRATAPQVEERCRQIRNVMPESSVSAWRAWERRSLTLLRDEARGLIRISVEVPIEQGEVIAQALERAAESGDSCVGLEFTTLRDPSVEGEGQVGGVRDAVDGSSMHRGHGLADRGHGSTATALTGNGWRAQQADALVALAKAYLSGGNGSGKPCSAADHHQVVIHTDASALRGGAALRGGISVDNSALPGGAALWGGTPLPGGLARSDLPIETVRRLTCDGSLITIVEDDDGTPLDVGRKRRTVTTALRRALWARDRHCSFPGCHNRCYVDAHHIEHWANGGKTSLENLTLLCTFHHTLLHEGGFKIKRDGEGALYFQRPDGRVIPRFGYRHDDMCDEYAVAENPSMEGCCTEACPSVNAYPSTESHPSMEVSGVREPAAVYYLTSARNRLRRAARKQLN
jgi:hypothetical protein